MLKIGQSQFGVGVVHVAAYGASGHDVVATAERLLLDPAIQAIEGTWPADGPQVEALRQRFLWSGADMVFLVGGLMRREKIDPNAADPQVRAGVLRRLKEFVELASFYGARMLLICSGPDTAPADRPAAVERLAEALKALCAHAKSVRPQDPMWITFEHFDRELDQKRLLGPTREAAALVAGIRLEHHNIGLTLDLSHVVQLGEDIEEAVATASDVLIHAHVANCGLDRGVAHTFGDSHCRFGAPGGAVGPEEVAIFLEALARHRYGDATLPTSVPLVSVEMKTPEGETPELAIAAGLRMLRRAAARADARCRDVAEADARWRDAGRTNQDRPS